MKLPHDTTKLVNRIMDEWQEKERQRIEKRKQSDKVSNRLRIALKLIQVNKDCNGINRLLTGFVLEVLIAVSLLLFIITGNMVSSMVLSFVGVVVMFISNILISYTSYYLARKVLDSCSGLAFNEGKISKAWVSEVKKEKR